MIAYFVLALALLGGGFYGGYSWEEGRWAKETAKRQQAEAEVAALGKELQQQAQNTIDDQMVAYNVGKSEARVVEKKVYVRLATESNLGAFANAECKLPPQSFGLLVASLKGVRGGLTIPPEDIRPPAVATPPSAPISTPAAPSGVAPPKPVPRKRGRA